MPNYDRRAKNEPDDDLEIASRILDTVQKQIASYRSSLEKLRELRREVELDSSLAKRIWSSPDAMAKFLVDRGIPQYLAVGMAAEDFQDEKFGAVAAIWTWDCCVTSCVFTYGPICGRCTSQASTAGQPDGGPKTPPNVPVDGGVGD